MIGMWWSGELGTDPCTGVIRVAHVLSCNGLAVGVKKMGSGATWLRGKANHFFVTWHCRCGTADVANLVLNSDDIGCLASQMCSMLATMSPAFAAWLPGVTVFGLCIPVPDGFATHQRAV